MVDNIVYKFFADYIYKHTGIVYAENEYYRLDRRLQHLYEAFGLSNIDQLYQLYNSNDHGGMVSKDMHEKLLEIATNNETYFFRDATHFDILTKVIIPEIQKERSGKGPHIWSAGCSTGQEPYSLLMTILDLFQDLKFAIDATDISAPALIKAKKGNYDNLEIQRGMPTKTLLKYFKQQEDDTWTIKSLYSPYINFSHLNLLSDSFPSSEYNVIFCRNVLIYQNQINKKNIVQKFYNALKPRGYFIMGSGESLNGLDIPLTRKFIEGGMVFQKEK
ncbi:MAG: protein-glutamate O-methyltransferase CheR [Oligoflexia bacterium]|nr:protein-glutamate O-methyltransferase CheR [Oligoflexia bacterium]